MHYPEHWSCLISSQNEFISFVILSDIKGKTCRSAINLTAYVPEFPAQQHSMSPPVLGWSFDEYGS